jgi:hypothetical protein
VMLRNTETGVERKRGPLAKACAELAGLRFAAAGGLSVDEMDFYGSVDSLIMPSLQEGAGLPPLEAAADSRLVIGSPVDHFPRLTYEGLGILAPLEARAFQKFRAGTLIYYRDNPAAYLRNTPPSKRRQNDGTGNTRSRIGWNSFRKLGKRWWTAP